MTQADLQRLLCLPLLGLWSVWHIDVLEECHHGSQATIGSYLAEPLHRRVDDRAGRHARAPRAAPEDRRHGRAATDGGIERPADEGKAVVLLLEVEDRHVRGRREALAGAHGTLEVLVPKGVRPADRARGCGPGRLLGRLVVVVVLGALLCVRIGHGVRSRQPDNLTRAEAGHTCNVSQTCNYQPASKDKRNGCRATFCNSRVFLHETCIELLEAFAHCSLEPLIPPVATEGRQFGEKFRMEMLCTKLRADVSICATPVALVQGVHGARLVQMLYGHTQCLGSLLEVPYYNVADLHCSLMAIASNCYRDTIGLRFMNLDVLLLHCVPHVEVPIASLPEDLTLLAPVQVPLALHEAIRFLQCAAAAAGFSLLACVPLRVQLPQGRAGVAGVGLVLPEATGATLQCPGFLLSREHHAAPQGLRHGRGPGTPNRSLGA
mmetsp:Transcript_130898/g.407044  ORF Transcript_130898/g.407044 Transcript_130898/m.407044 type:complete len:435 (-) Transcript_130898:7-1311(-)